MAMGSDELFDKIERLNKEGNVTQEVRAILKKKGPIVVEDIRQDLVEFRDYLKKYDK